MKTKQNLDKSILFSFDGWWGMLRHLTRAVCSGTEYREALCKLDLPQNNFLIMVAPGPKFLVWILCVSLPLL